jgi:hypothetical protein
VAEWKAGSINLGGGKEGRGARVIPDEGRFVGLIIADVAPDDKGGFRVRCTV